MATNWSEAAKAKRSASAKKAAETRKAKKAQLGRNLMSHAHIRTDYPYIQNSRVARWALSNVSILAMMRGASYIRWGRPTLQMRLPFDAIS